MPGFLMKKKKGMSLIEMAIVIVFISISLPPLFFGIGAILERFTTVDTIQKALEIAQAKIEFILSEQGSRGWGYIANENYPDENVYWPDTYMPGQWVMMGGDPYGPKPVFVVKTNIEDISATLVNGAGTELNIQITNLMGAQPEPLDGYNFSEDIKRVTVSVYRYGETGGAPAARLYVIINKYDNRMLWWN